MPDVPHVDSTSNMRRAQMTHGRDGVGATTRVPIEDAVWGGASPLCYMTRHPIGTRTRLLSGWLFRGPSP